MSNRASLRQFFSLNYRKFVGNTLDTEHQFNDDLFSKPPDTEKIKKKRTRQKDLLKCCYSLYFLSN